MQLDLEYYLRHELNDTFEAYKEVRLQFIDSLTFKQLREWQKQCRNLRGSQNSIKFDQFNLDRITTSKDKQQLFKQMVDLYRAYQAVVRRSQFELIQGDNEQEKAA